MLDTETKRRIDTARDILVGKVPDPKSQVEQITIALIYKFMDDMDKEALSFGGKATFFTGEYEQYSWTNIFDTKVGGHEMLKLYGEAIVKLNLNPNIPQLFRDIFKNAYLPYRDPETLKLFLKTINEFRYDHSEMLGDAFEYLLSILGSQGDAGQFRTPRHIIDFIVEVMQPKKNESILDPACGTAGFLISSYKHILQNNTKKTKGDLLTPDNRKTMTKNFVGYDISPDMVRLSLVNLYLHGFTTPSIYEYDTLTSEDRWNDYFDVVIANPPFMTPKGGVKPHSRFTLKSNRTEVLFVDYIAEHINPESGRAGIIVPEGIVFQSPSAYKQLRKMLIEKNFLYAVVSLPSGVFQPYSGVKTSILLIDKILASRTENILFVKVENDGYDLGAQRQPIEKNDLPNSISFIKEYQKSLQDRSDFSLKLDNAWFLPKKEILSGNDISLSIDKHLKGKVSFNGKYKMTTLNDVCDFVRGPFGGSLKKEIFVKDGYKVYEQKNAIQNDFAIGRYCIDEAKFNEMKRFEVFPDDLIISCSGTMGKIAIAPTNIKRGIINQALLKLTPNTSKTSAFFIKLWLETEFIQTNYFRDNSGAAIQNVSSVKYLKEIPFPDISLSEQEEIANQIQQHLINIDALESEIKIEQSSINDIVKSISHIEKEYKVNDEKLSIAAEE